MKDTSFVIASLFLGAGMLISQTAHAQDIAPDEPITTTMTGTTAVSSTIEIAPKSAKATTLVYLPITIRLAASMQNGSFDAGGASWTEYSAKGSLPLIRTTFVGSVTPRSPAHASWMGGIYNDTQYLQQVVTVPSGQPYLAYYHWIASADVCGYDFASIRVNGATLATYDLCDGADTDGWIKKVVDLSAYAGQQVTLRIHVTTDGSGNSNLFIDDVAFQADANVIVAGTARNQAESFTQYAPAAKPATELPAEEAAALKSE